MSLDLATILPNITHSLEGTGFLFGAGTSAEAGYPMMSGLTRKVVGGLKPDERAVLDEVLKAVGSAYDDKAATPNIEELADLVIAHAINSKDARCATLETKFRELVVQEILSVKNPSLDNHVQLFRALSKRTFGRPCTVWIFTTNYDLLFEVAAAKAGGERLFWMHRAFLQSRPIPGNIWRGCGESLYPKQPTHRQAG